MKEQELLQIIIAILAMTIISGFNELISFDISSLGLLLLFSFIIICGNILGKKIIALQLDSNVQHELWQWKRFGFRPAWHLKKSIPMGIILPIFFTIFTLGYFKIFTFLTYETRALKRRAARRFGHMSF
ncbi:MAG: hypothetical protein U1E54_05180, partial [Candidatus Levybacteria bacterium]|nr:hypothetical protein [Candidatus Levybacteria bacterium]